MAGLLLFVLLMCSFHEIQGQALPPPKLTVNPPVITETDSVTLNCQTPSSVSVSQCYFFTATQYISEGICVKTLKLSELLKMVQSLPANVEVRCFYTVKSGAGSPHSDPSTITIHNVPPPKLTVNPSVGTVTDSVTLNCQTPSSVSVSQCHFYTVNRVAFHTYSCLLTITGSELLKISHQSSPAEVQVRCFYTVQLLNVNSPFSDISSITIESQKPDMALQLFEGDDVLFSCSLPGSVKRGTRCNLYFGEVSRPILTTTVWKRSSKTKQWLCHFTVPVDDLLKRLDSVHQKDASCDYNVESEHNSLSPRSDRRSLSDVVAKESNRMIRKSTFTMTAAGSTVTMSSVSTPITSVNPTSDVVAKESKRTSTKSTFTMTAAGSTVTMSSVSTPITSVNPTSESGTANVSPTNTVTSSGDNTAESSVMSKKSTFTMTTAGLTVTMPSVSVSITSVNPTSATSVLKLFVLVAGIGLSIVVILLVLVFRKHLKRRTDRSSYKIKTNTTASVVDDSVCMRSINHGGEKLPADNIDMYSLITSVPAVDCSTAGFEKLNRREPQSEDSDIYHVYSTIPEQPTASDPQDMLYSVLQAH